VINATSTPVRVRRSNKADLVSSLARVLTMRFHSENDSFFGVSHVRRPGWYASIPHTHSLSSSRRQFDPTPRDPLEPPAFTKNAKDGSIVCKKHNSATCNQCCE
jgi:hypothetical protein